MSGFSFIRDTRAVGFLFPGQGSQEVGMASRLAADYPAAKAAFDEADAILGFALSRLCFEGPEEVLTDTINAQPALLAASVATLRALESELQQSPLNPPGLDAPVYVAGHSMGEYTALVAAGSLSYADGLRLVRERGRLMKMAGEKRPGMMAAILGLDEAHVAAICADATAEKGIAQVANDNCPGQVVISGDQQGMDRGHGGTGKGRRTKNRSSGREYCLSQPTDATSRRGASIRSLTPLLSRRRSCPIIANTTAVPVTRVEEIRAELVAQLTGSVRWTASIQRALDDGITDFVEIGPGDVLVGLVRRINRKAGRHSVNDPETVRKFAEWMRKR